MYPLGGLCSMRAFKATLPYWIPVLSFSGMIYSYWDLESRLLSLSKFVERNVNWAKKHIAMSYFIRDYVAEAAYWNIWERTEDAEAFGTGEFIQQLVRECERLERLHNRFDDLMAAVDHEAMIKQWTPDYWVTSFLLTTRIRDNPAVDDRTREDFRIWFRVYLWYTLLICFLFIFLLLSTVVTHLRHQGIVEQNVFTRWFAIDSLGQERYWTANNAPAIPEIYPSAVGGNTTQFASLAIPLRLMETLRHHVH